MSAFRVSEEGIAQRGWNCGPVFTTPGAGRASEAVSPSDVDERFNRGIGGGRALEQEVLRMRAAAGSAHDYYRLRPRATK